MPSDELFLGIDLGTTGVKASLLNSNGQVIAQSRVEYKLYRQHNFWAEQDPWEWWSAVCSAVKEVICYTEASGDGRNILGIGVSSQAPTLLGIDRRGNPVGRAAIWMDRRSEATCATLRERIRQIRQGSDPCRKGEKNRQGSDPRRKNPCRTRIDPYYMLPKLVWQMDHEPERYHRTYQYIQANGWVVYQLTGEFSIDVTHAALTQLYDIYQERWDTDLTHELGIATEKLPRLYECTEKVGGLTKEASAILGLREGIPVVAGAIDGASAPLGLGLVEAGQAFEMSGQSSGIGIILNEPISHPNLVLLKHAVPGKWILKGSMSSTGGSMQWFRDYIDGKIGQTDAYDTYEEEIGRIPAGAQGLAYLPYLAGDRAPLWDTYARGVFFGLHQKTGKPHMMRAIMEGAAYGLKSILEEIEQAGLQVQCLYGTGGGYRSNLWTQMKADILERRIEVMSAEYETASMGAAYLAMVSIMNRNFSDIPAIRSSRVHEPNDKTQQIYRTYYSIFKALYTRNKDLFELLHTVGVEQ